MDNITCTDYCITQTEKANASRKAYKTAWPNYCQSCEGRGGHAYSYDPSPAGVSLAPGSMWDQDPCSECVEEGLCPRCGKHAWDDNDESTWEPGFSCPHCGWTDGVEQDFMRPPHECYCWELVSLRDR